MNNQAPGSVYKPADFNLLWAGQTISVLGTMIGVSAMGFTAILLLHATPFQMGLLGAARLVPGVLLSLYAGAWTDRRQLRPVLIAADLGRAVILASIPLAAALHVLCMEQLYIVTFLVSMLTIFFNISYESYLPVLVSREDLITGNSKLAASASIAEIGGFSMAGWLVQLFSAPFGILLDAVSFLLSALCLCFISTREGEKPVVVRQGIRSEIGEGIREVLGNPFLKAMAICMLMLELSMGMNGSVILLYMTRELGFQPGVLGLIWAVGGISSLIAAMLAARTTNRFGIGPVMIASLLLAAIAMVFIPLARGATWSAALLLIASQLLGDGAMVIFGINNVSLRQSVAPGSMLGRVNATMQFIAISATLAGSLIGGLSGELTGVRGTLFIGACGTFLSVLWLIRSPVRTLYVQPEQPASSDKIIPEHTASVDYSEQ